MLKKLWDDILETSIGLAVVLGITIVGIIFLLLIALAVVITKLLVIIR